MRRLDRTPSPEPTSLIFVLGSVMWVLEFPVFRYRNSSHPSQNNGNRGKMATDLEDGLQSGHASGHGTANPRYRHAHTGKVTTDY